MNLPRITTNTLPSIRIHDQVAMDASSDSNSSTNSQRSLPRDIPVPNKHHSPTSSAGGSLHGSATSQVIPPPFLPLNPPTQLPNYHHTLPNDGARHELKDEIARRPRFKVVDVRERDRRRTSNHGSPVRDDSPRGIDRLNLQSDSLFEKDWEPRRNLSSPKELQSEESLRVQIQQSVTAYDSSLVRKLGGGSTSSEPSRYRHTPPRPFSPSSQEVPPPLPLFPQPKNLPSSVPLQIPSSSSFDLPLSRWAHASPLSDSSLNAGSGVENHPALPSALAEFRTTGDDTSVSSHHTDNDHSSDSRLRRSISASLLGAGYDEVGRHSKSNSEAYNDDGDSQVDDTPASHVAGMRLLTLQEAARTPPKSNSYPSQYHQRAGSKRRASSPPNEDHPFGNSEPTRKAPQLDSIGSEIYSHNRRTPPLYSLRNSPGGQSRYYSSPAQRSATSSFTSSSATTTWSTSMGQFSGASSITTADRASPVGSFSPSNDLEVVSDAPFRQVASIGMPSRPANRQRLVDPSIVAALTGIDKEAHQAPPKMTGMFICECCPKKPKKFDNRDDLQLHEMEKQYSCQYCNNRFKNKNEAERHQNSLHLRKHSWSCAALAGNYEAAFHQSPQHPNYADICGYCGKEFAVPPQWNARIEHLTTEHKFGECNQSKKFYRADHFRQHLKHSHSGTSGKWTNVLENACMRDELPPTPINRGGHGGHSVISEEISE